MQRAFQDSEGDRIAWDQPHAFRLLLKLNHNLDSEHNLVTDFELLQKNYRDGRHSIARGNYFP
jgi:hypothetical protein